MMSLNAANSRDREIIFGIFIAACFFFAGLVTLGDYGITADSPENFLWGDIYLRFFETWDMTYLKYGVGENPLIEEPPEPINVFYFKEMYEPWRYPPVANMISALTHRIFHESLLWLDDIEAHHLAILLMSAGTVYFVFVMASEAFGFIPGAIASVSLCLFPQFIAHSHNNLKDAPMAFFFTITVYSFWRAARTLDVRWAITAGLFLGLSMNVKINAFFIPAIVFLWLFFTYKGGNSALGMPHAKLRGRFVSYGLRRREYPSKYNFFVVAFMTVITVYATWPYLWGMPLKGLLESLRYFSDAGVETPTIYNGAFYPSSNLLPPYYAPHYLLIVTPPVLLVFIALGLWQMGGYLRSKGTGQSETADMSLLLLIWIAVPLMKYAIPGSIVYHGIRHFLEVLPPLCIVAGLGGERIYRFAKSVLCRENEVLSRVAAMFVLSLLFLPLILTIVEIHPYEVSYFNFLVGGIKGAEGRYELDYWCSSFKEAGEWLAKRQGPETAIIVPLQWDVAMYYVKTNLMPRDRNYIVLWNSPAHYNISWIPQVMRDVITHVREKETPVHVVEVDGAALASVYELNKSAMMSIYGKDYVSMPSCYTRRAAC